MQYVLKILISAILIVLIAEISKRNTLIGAIFASLPLTSLLAITWLYIDTKNIVQVSELSWNIMIAVIPSFVFFISLPLLLKWEINFWLSILLACLLTAVAYWGYMTILSK